MKDDYNEFLSKNIKIIVVCPHDFEKVEKYFTKNKLPYPGIPDLYEKIIKPYKQEFNPLKLGRMPAMFLINEKGIIEYAYYSQSMSDIPDNKTILAMIE